MKRISRKYIVVGNFSGRTAPAVAILEAFGRSAFKNFKANFYNELKNFFPYAKKVETKEGNARDVVFP